MGVSGTSNVIQYTGDGSSTVFSFPYYFFNPADLQVYLYNTASSIVTPQVLNTNYTVSGNANSQGVYPTGGSVVMNSAFPSSLQIVINRSPQQVQTFSQAQNGPVNSQGLNQELDYLTLLIQELQAQVNLCLQLPAGMGTPSQGAFSPTLPQSVANIGSAAYAYLTVNSAANGIALLIASTSASAFTGILAVANGGLGNGSIPQGTILWMSSATVVSGLTAINLGGSFVSGTLPTSLGGTGTNSSYSYPQYGVLYASSATSFATVPSTTAGLFLKANGSSAPTFEQLNFNSSSMFINALPIANGGTAGSSGVQALTNLWPAGITRGDILVVNSSGLVTRVGVGNDNQVLTANSSAGNTAGVLWQAANSASLSLTTKTANYQMTSSDDFILTNSSNFNVYLPDATTCTKKPYRISKTDSPLAQVVIVASGAQTIGTVYGSSVSLFTQNESWTLYPDGAGWQINDHSCNTMPTPYTPALFAGFTAASSAFYWHRVGALGYFRGNFSSATMSGSTIQISFPSGITTGSSINNPTIMGSATENTFALAGAFFLLAQPNATVMNIGVQAAGAGQAGGIPNIGTIFTNGANIQVQGYVQVAGWQA